MQVWNSNADLDTVVTDPNGCTIWFQKKASACPGAAWGGIPQRGGGGCRQLLFSAGYELASMLPAALWLGVPRSPLSLPAVLSTGQACGGQRHGSMHACITERSICPGNVQGSVGFLSTMLAAGPRPSRSTLTSPTLCQVEGPPLLGSGTFS